MTEQMFDAVSTAEVESRKEKERRQIIALNTLITSLYILMLQGFYVRGMSLVSMAIEAELNEALATVLARFDNGVASVLETGIKAAMAGDVNGYNQFLDVLEQETGIKLDKVNPDPELIISTSIKSGGLSLADKTPASVYFATLEKVSERVSGQLGRLISAGIKANASVSDIVKSVMLSMAPDNQNVRQYLSGLFGDMSQPANSMRLHLERMGIPVGQHKPIMDLYNSSRRLAISELSRSFYETDLYLYHNSPIVKAVRWKLNPLHPEYDVCDHLAEFNGGLGKGVYPTNLAPGLPHPYCGCYLEPVYYPQGEWKNPPAKPTEMNYKPFPIPDIKGMTNNYADRQHFFFKKALAFRGGSKAIRGL